MHASTFENKRVLYRSLIVYSLCRVFLPLFWLSFFLYSLIKRLNNLSLSPIASNNPDCFKTAKGTSYRNKEEQFIAVDCIRGNWQASNQVWSCLVYCYFSNWISYTWSKDISMYLCVYLCTLKYNCVPQGIAVCFMVYLCTWWYSCVPDGIAVYLMVYLCIWWYSYVPDGIAVYLME